MNKNIIKGLITISIISMFLTGCSIKDKNINFNIDLAKYSKEDTSEYVYEINGDKLIINSDCSSITLKKDDVDKVQFKIKKVVGGNDEEKLQEALENIKVECDNDTMNISCPSLQGTDFSSINNESEIIIPDTINYLDIENDIGDIIMEGNYEDLNIDSNTGDISFNGNSDNFNAKNDVGDVSVNGEVKQCKIDSDVGDIKLDLKNIDDDYNYFIKGDVGNININLPSESKIQLSGSSRKKAEISSEINCGDEGPVFDIDMNVSDIYIDGV